MKYTAIFLVIIIGIAGFCLGGYRLLPQYKPPQVGNPFAEFESLEDTFAYAEFSITIPENFGNVSEKTFRVLRSEKKIRRLIEIIYSDEEGKEIIRFRKSFGKADISGDYTKYPIVEDAESSHGIVKLKGTEDGFFNATWAVTVFEAGEENQFAYSVMTQTPLSRPELLALVENIS